MLDLAMEQCKRVEWENGVLGARSSWWRLRYLRNAATLSDALTAATTSDILLVSVAAGRDLPPGLEEWAEGWLARGSAQAHALIGLFGLVRPRGAESSKVQLYLQSVARRGRLHYVGHERFLPARLSRLTNTALPN
jgi:hypothetical protein